jgi:hypothetical protein
MRLCRTRLRPVEKKPCVIKQHVQVGRLGFEQVHHVRTVETVVNRLLTAACADVEAGVRRCILDALQKSTALDTYLAQADW